MTLLDDKTVQAIIRRGENDFAALGFSADACKPETALIAHAAKQRGLRTLIRKNAFIEIRSAGHSIVFSKDRYHTSVVEAYLSARWASVKERLRQKGITVPEGRFFTDFAQAHRYFKASNSFALIRPMKTDRHTDLQPVSTEQQFATLWESEIAGNRRLLVEQYTSGIELRFLTLGGKVLSAVAFVPACIVGDGERTLEELLSAKSALRKRHPVLGRKDIDYSKENRKESGVGLSIIPKRDEIVPLDTILRDAGDSEAVAVKTLLPPTILDLVESAAQAIPLIRYAEVVLVCDTPTDTPRNITLRDIRSAPIVGMTSFPCYGVFESVVDSVIDDFLSHPRPAEAEDPKRPAGRDNAAGSLVKAFKRNDDLQVALIKRAAYRRNLAVTAISRNLYAIEHHEREVLFKDTTTEFLSLLSRRISTNRPWTKRLLAKAGIHTPAEKSLGKSAPGNDYRAYVIGRSVVAASRRVSEDVGVDMTDEIHPEFCKLAAKAKETIFNPLNAEISIIAEDIGKPPDGQNWSVVEINTEPDLVLYHFPTQGVPRDVAGALIEYLFPRGLAGADSFASVQVIVQGKVQKVGYRKWMLRNALLRGIDGWVKNKPDGSVEAALHGASAALDDLLGACKNGPAKAVVTDIAVRAVSDTLRPGFVIKYA